MSNFKTELKEEALNQLADLHAMQLGTDEYRTTVEGISKLADRAIELEKLEIEHREKMVSREIERELELMKIEESRKERFWKNCVAVGTFLGGAGLTVWGALKSWKFEETGTVTSTAGREFMKKFFKR